jgi:hypothetical protein
MAKRNGNRNRHSRASGGGPLGELRPLAPATLTGGGPLGELRPLAPADFVEAKPMTGGSGAADYAISVYGNGDAQQAVAGSNVIAMNNPNAVVVAPVTGGNRGGRGMLTDMAVPALLLYANNKFKRTAKRMRKTVRRTAKKILKRKKATRGKR